jgi:hypothetical protein
MTVAMLLAVAEDPSLIGLPCTSVLEQSPMEWASKNSLSGLSPRTPGSARASGLGEALEFTRGTRDRVRAPRPGL